MLAPIKGTHRLPYSASIRTGQPQMQDEGVKVPRGRSRVAWERKGFGGDGGGKASLTLEGLATMTRGQNTTQPIRIVIHPNLSFIHRPQNNSPAAICPMTWKQGCSFSIVERLGTS